MEFLLIVIVIYISIFLFEGTKWGETYAAILLGLFGWAGILSVIIQGFPKPNTFMDLAGYIVVPYFSWMGVKAAISIFTLTPMTKNRDEDKPE